MAVPRLPFVRNAIIATALLGGAYGLRAAAPLDSLLLAFNPLRVTTVLWLVYPEALDPVVFIGELFVLGVVGTAVAHLVHTRATDARHAGWHLGVAGALGIVGGHWIKWGIAFAGTTHTETEPIVITGVSGLVLLGLAGGIAGKNTELNG